jgi:quercetin dioxygenase-like cupin family protein
MPKGVFMKSDPNRVVVTEEFCNACGTPRVIVHHQNFPEMQISGESPEQAADELVTRLEANLSAVSDPMHRAPVQFAITDLQSFIHRDAVPQSKLSEVIDVRAATTAEPGASPSTLAKTETLELRRLTLPKGREIPTHHARGEIIVHCLAGRIAFTSGDTTRHVGDGQLIILAAGEPHRLVGLEDSSVLVTKVLLVRPTAS